MKKKAASKKKKATKKASPKKTARASKLTSAKKVQPKTTKTAVPVATPETGEKLTFNHAMIYVKDVERGMRFYHDMMGFKLIEDFRYEGTPVYARLRAPGGDGTIALHLAGPGAPIASEGVGLYFEVRDLDGFLP